MVYELLFYSSGNSKPIDEFIGTCEHSARAKIFRGFELLREHGIFVGMPHVKKLEGPLYELRIRGQQELRLIFTLYKKNTIYFLHAFKKKSQKTPRPEIEIASRRLTTI